MTTPLDWDTYLTDNDDYDDPLPEANDLYQYLQKYTRKPDKRYRTALLDWYKVYKEDTNTSTNGQQDKYNRSRLNKIFTISEIGEGSNVPQETTPQEVKLT